MITRTHAAIALAGAAIVALLVGTGLGWWNGSRPGHALARPLAARTQLTPTAAFFGDPIVAQVAVDLDSRVVDPGSVRVDPSFAPYVESAAPTVDRSSVGRDETVVYSYTIQCVSDGCLPVGGPRTVRFPPVVVTATAAGRPVRTTAAWPAATVSSRLSKADLSTSRPRFRHSSPLPPPVYGVSPGGLALALTVVGGLLGAAAVVLLGIELAALLRRRRASLAEPTPLEAALAFVRDSAGRRDAADRRKALELLAEALEGEGNATLADAAERVAWAEPPPSGEHALEVVHDVEARGEAEPA